MKIRSFHISLLFITAASLLPVLAGCVERPEEVLIPAGEFIMGSDDTNAVERRPAHRVRITRAFSMGTTEVTVGEFRSFIEDTGYHTTFAATKVRVWTGSYFEYAPDARWDNPHYPQTDNQPACCISWLDAVHFCNWRSLRRGLTPCYTIDGEQVRCDFSAGGYRLPTEAEWEYAARGGPASRGNRYPGGDQAEAVAWFLFNSGMTTHPVAQKTPNELGLYDMAGNVWEWCWDVFRAYPEGAQVDPTGPDPEHLKNTAETSRLFSMGDYRVARGGCWQTTFRSLETTARVRYDIRNKLLYGMRLVRTAAAE
jgi:sulfatase modifying factor 1